MHLEMTDEMISLVRQIAILKANYLRHKDEGYGREYLDAQMHLICDLQNELSDLIAQAVLLEVRV